MNNEKGLTLIEVVASVVLLSVIFVTIFGFFINSYQFNAINNDNLQGMNIARVYEATLNGQTIDDIVTEDPLNSTYFIQTYEQDGYTIKISVKKSPESGKFYQELHLAHIQVFQDGKKVSETYTYVEGNVVATP